MKPRAASSVALNLAEGLARSSRRDQTRFFDIAFASLKESQAILDVSLSTDAEIVELADKLGAHLYKLRAASRGR